METSKQVSSTINILVHVIILFTFLSLFFFMYISKVESDAFKNELGGLVKDRINDIIDKNPDAVVYLQSPEFKPYLTRFMRRYSTESRATLERDTMIKFLAVFTIFILLGVLFTMVLTVTLECNKKVNLGSILAQNAVIFIFVGIAEYLFFTRVAIKYVPVAPSLMVDTIIDALKSEMKTQN
jgi:hypothetical protein